MSGYSWLGDSFFEVNTIDPLSGYGIPDFGDTYSLLEQRNVRSGINFIVKQAENAINLQWLAGYSYSTMEISDTRLAMIRHSTGDLYRFPQGFPGAGQPLIDAPFPSDGMDRNVSGFFTQFKWEAVEDFFILAGVRLDDYSDFGTQLTPRIGFIFLPTPSSALNLLYGNAFRAPSGNELKGLPGNVIAGDESLEPEEIDVYELIYLNKSTDWKFGTTLFYSKWENGIVLERNPNYDEILNPTVSNDIYAGVGENYSYGVEVETAYAIRKWLFDVSVSYVRSHSIDSFNQVTRIRDDYDFKMFPEIMANVGITYHLERYNTRIYFNNRFMDALYDTHYDQIPLSDPVTEPTELPLYWRTDINISTIFSRNLELALDIRNLFDRENEIGAVWGNRNRKGHEEEGLGAMISLRYTL